MLNKLNPSGNKNLFDASKVNKSNFPVLILYLFYLFLLIFFIYSTILQIEDAATLYLTR